MAIRYFTVKNLAKFQHYKDRNPPWIKLYTKLIDDYEFNELPSATQRDLMMIWLLVSKEPERRMPYNPVWVAQKIHARNPVDLDALSDAGFIIPDSEALAPMPPKDASNLASEEASGTVAFPSVSLSSLDSSSLFSFPNSESSLDPNRSSETIVVHEPVEPKAAAAARRHRLPDDFELNDADRRVATECHVDAEKVLVEFKTYWKGTGKPMADWHAVYQNRCRQLEGNSRFASSTPRAGPAPLKLSPGADHLHRRLLEAEEEERVNEQAGNRQIADDHQGDLAGTIDRRRDDRGVVEVAANGEVLGSPRRRDASSASGHGTPIRSASLSFRS